MDCENDDTSDIIPNEWIVYSCTQQEWLDLERNGRSTVRAIHAPAVESATSTKEKFVIRNERAHCVVAALGLKHGDVDAAIEFARSGKENVKIYVGGIGVRDSLDLLDLDFTNIKSEYVRELASNGLDYILNILKKTYLAKIPVTPGNYAELLTDSRIREKARSEKMVIYSVAGKSVFLQIESPLLAYDQLQQVIDKLSDGGKIDSGYHYYPWDVYADFLARVLMYNYQISVLEEGLVFSKTTNWEVNLYDVKKFTEVVSIILSKFEDYLHLHGVLKLVNRQTKDIYSLVYAAIFDSGLLYDDFIMREVRIVQTVIRGKMETYFGLTKQKLRLIYDPKTTYGDLEKILNEILLQKGSIEGWARTMEEEDKKTVKVEDGSRGAEKLLSVISEIGVRNVSYLEVERTGDNAVPVAIEEKVKSYGGGVMLGDWGAITKYVYSGVKMRPVPSGWQILGDLGPCALNAKNLPRGKYAVRYRDEILQLRSEIFKEIVVSANRAKEWDKMGRSLTILKVTSLALAELSMMIEICHFNGLGIRVRKGYPWRVPYYFFEFGHGLETPAEILSDWVAMVAESHDQRYFQVIGRLLERCYDCPQFSDVDNNLALIKFVGDVGCSVLVESSAFEDWLKDKRGTRIDVEKPSKLRRENMKFGNVT